LVYWIFDELFGGKYNFKKSNLKELSKLIIGFIIAICGIILSSAVSIPDSASIVTSFPQINTSIILESFARNILNLGGQFKSTFFSLPEWFRNIILWLLILSLWIRPRASLALFSGILLLGVFFDVVLNNNLRGQGLILIFSIVLYWIVYHQIIHSEEKKRKPKRLGMFKVGMIGVLSVIFVLHVKAGVLKVHKDIKNEFSSSKKLGEFLKANADYHEAILIGEPDYLLEPLPYYAPNKIYIPREKKYGRRVMFTIDNKRDMSLGQLLDTGQRLKKETGKPIILALGHFNLPNRYPKEIEFSYGKKFYWSDEDMGRLYARTKKIAEFKSANRENYELYLFK